MSASRSSGRNGSGPCTAAAVRSFPSSADTVEVYNERHQRADRLRNKPDSAAEVAKPRVFTADSANG